ncbi:uncharacterized protein RCC_06554 [Ramularia collo-cygni]|uniref:Amino acid permease/ SLC12A domain-containing protein n=1 Tax=Ramularia collo-cygni TaxID=112498 RepID=A0A2D3VAK8_9PEZI|nr:uncharacterized protein RCC_06554 [Ramularia collo-cygni]CZT20696.1 uncharacterized protein RCC_06554 [Ramularia collo-cygni]
MSQPRPPLKPHFSAVDIESSPSSGSSTSSIAKDMVDRQKLASPTAREFKAPPAISRKHVVQQNLRNGGLAGLFWTTVWAHIGHLFVVLSLAEMSSMVPLSGGQYRFVTAFAPSKSQRRLSYFTGWVCSIGWQARFTLHCYIVTNLVQSLVHPDMAATRWQTHLYMVLVAVVMSVFNAFAAGHLSIAEGLFAICHVFVLVPILVSLWVLASPKEKAKHVFLTFTDNGGQNKWPSKALSVCVGQLSSVFVLLGSDAMSYIAEEVEDAEIIVPRCVVWSFLFNAPITLGLIVTFLFNLGSITDALDDEHALTSIFDRMLDGDRGATIGFTSGMLDKS